MDNSKVSNKGKIKKIGLALASLLIVMIFFSNTAYSFNQPTVTGVMPKNGKLKKTEKTMGITDWLNKKDIYSQLSGTVKEVLVQEGDRVSAGQELFRIEYDRDEITKKQRENAIAKEKALLDIESTKQKIQKINESIRALEAEVYKTDSISTFDMEESKRQIENLEKKLDDTKKLFDGGAVPQSDLDKAQLELDSAKDKLKDLERQYDESKTKSQETLDDKEKERNNKINAYNNEIKEYNQQIKARQLDYKSLQLADETYVEQLEKFNNNEVITAPADGAVYKIDVKEGQYISEHALLISLGAGNEFVIDCVIPRDNNFISTGDECLISNSSYRLKAKVKSITAEENGKKVQLIFENDEITSGETFNIEFSEESQNSYTLIPNGALNKDKDGYFIYRLSQRDGILGKEYYPSKVRVSIGDNDSDNTVITKGIDFFEPIVLLSDKPFVENQAIKIKNESDFFDK